MIKKIIAFTIPFCFLIAVVLYLMGYERVELGSEFYAFMRMVSKDFENWKFEIPSIPMLSSLGDNYVVLVDFVNALVQLLNFIILFTNYVIMVIQFILTIFYELFAMLGRFQPNYTSFVGVRAF